MQNNEMPGGGLIIPSPIIVSGAPTQPEPLMTLPQWLEAAENHVRVSDDLVASIEGDLSESLPPHLALMVERAVEVYNGLPLDWRQMEPGDRQEEPEGPLIGRADEGPCVPVLSPSYFWWGERIFVNHCLIATIAVWIQAGVGFAGIIALIAGLMNPVVTSVLAAATVVGIVASIYLAALQACDTYCGDQGANINALWFPPGIYWVSTIC
jgi:hypothetical protein